MSRTTLRTHFAVFLCNRPTCVRHVVLPWRQAAQRGWTRSADGKAHYCPLHSGIEWAGKS